MATRIFLFVAPATTLLQTLITLALTGRNSHPGWVTDVSMTLKWIGMATLVLLGYGLAYMIGNRPDKTGQYSEEKRSATWTQSVIWLKRGLSLQLGISFIANGAEQYLDVADIEKWFIASGYTAGFMYLIIAIQIIAGALLLLNLRFHAKTSVVSLLLAIMIGAVITHIRRGDAFNIAIAATVLAIKCILLLWICRMLQTSRPNSYPFSNSSQPNGGITF